MGNRKDRAILIDRIMTMIFYIIAGFFLLLLIGISVYVIGNGFKEFEFSLLKGGRDGIGDQLFNTIYLVFLSLVISVPIGVLAGIYMAEYAPKNKVTKFLRICIETLSSLPSIVLGLFGALILIVSLKANVNLMAGAITVSILSIPLLTTTTEDAMKSLPRKYKEGSYGLGATKWQTIYKVLLPTCIPRIITGIILAAGRGFGEAAALLFTSGMSTDINWSEWDITSPMCPLNPFRPGQTLSLVIWGARTEGALHANAEQIANLSSAVLMLLVFGFSILSRVLTKYLNSRGNK